MGAYAFQPLSGRPLYGDLGISEHSICTNDDRHRGGPGTAMEAGFKVKVSMYPFPEADKAIAELKPPEIVFVVTLNQEEGPHALERQRHSALRAKMSPPYVAKRRGN
jgi:hypothetical protein